MSDNGSILEMLLIVRYKVLAKTNKVDIVVKSKA